MSLFRLYRTMLGAPRVTEPIDVLTGADDRDVAEAGAEVRAVIDRLYGGRSLRIRAVDAGSTNAEEIELTALGNAYYDIERFGLSFVASPRHADLLMVTGPVVRNLERALRTTYEAAPQPCLVAAVGDGACTGGIWLGSYAVVGPVDAVIPVHIRIPGDPPAPAEILRGLAAGLGEESVNWDVSARVGLLIALGAHTAAAVAGLGAARRAWARAAHALMAIGAAAGLAGTAAFLASGTPDLTIGAAPVLFGAPLAVDRLSAFFLLLLYAVTSMTAWYASRYVEAERARYAPRIVLPLTALFVLAMQGVLLSSGVASFLLFWEAMSLAAFFLVMADGEEESRRAALMYLSVAQFGAGALLVGLGLLSGGSLAATFDTLPVLAGTLSPGMTILATALVFFAFTSKAGLAPFHAWLPEAHPCAPSFVSALMSGVMLKVAVYGLIRFTAACWPGLPSAWGIGLVALGLAGAGLAAISANLAREIKRILAWSSVENIGLILAMFGFQIVLRSGGRAAAADAVLAAMFVHMAAHALFKSGLFLGAGAVIHGAHTAKIEALGGLANRMPALSAAMLALVVAAAALPPSGTFVAEWMLIQATLSALATRSPEAILVGVAMLVGSAFVAGIAVFAMVRLFGFVFLAEPRSAAARAAVEPEAALRGPVIALAVATAALGLAAPWATTFVPVPPGGPEAPWTGGDPRLPLAVGAALAAGLAGAWLVRRLFSGGAPTRRYHTWDCGQPIDETMEYTATGFSAPVRFFLRDLVRAEKHLVFTPVVPDNPWIKRGQMEFRKTPDAMGRVYLAIARLIEGVGAWLKRLQNGVIQFYIALILATLLATLWVAL